MTSNVSGTTKKWNLDDQGNSDATGAAAASPQQRFGSLFHTDEADQVFHSDDLGA